MKLTRKQVQRKSRSLPEVQFADQKLSSFSGLLLFQILFDNLKLRERLRACFRHVKTSSAYDVALQFLALVVHILLGYRQLRDIEYYRNDPLVLRLLGLRKLPSVATLSRTLGSIRTKSVEMLRELARELVLQRLVALEPRRLTLDFDGSVLGTCRRAEGTAVGFNKKKKGQRSYYPLFCTVAQTGQVFDFHHRPGNVHDSNGAREFIRACVEAVQVRLPKTLIEVRMDSAFFSDAIVGELGRTQAGNNNAYCHDGELTWVDWQLPDAADWTAWIRRLTDLRRRLRPPAAEAVEWRRPDGELWQPTDEADSAAAFAARWQGSPADGERREALLLVNGSEREVEFALPSGTPWSVSLDTSAPATETRSVDARYRSRGPASTVLERGPDR